MKLHIIDRTRKVYIEILDLCYINSYTNGMLIVCIKIYSHYLQDLKTYGLLIYKINIKIMINIHFLTFSPILHHNQSGDFLYINISNTYSHHELVFKQFDFL